MFGGLHGKRVCDEHKTWTCGCRGTQAECDSPERPADKAALEEWIREAWAKRAAMDGESFDQRRERARLAAEIDDYLDELLIHVLAREMDAELA